MSKPFIGIKKVLYGDAMPSMPNGQKFDGKFLASLLATVGKENAKLKNVANVHQDTWGYEESDPTITEYKNQLTGLPYYRDVEEAGVPTVSFTLGEYDLETKAELQGGKVIDGAWHRRDMLNVVAKLIVAQTKTGNWIVMPNANIIGKGNFVDKNIGLGVTAVPVETEGDGLSPEMWFNEEDVTTTQGGTVEADSGFSAKS